MLPHCIFLETCAPRSLPGFRVQYVQLCVGQLSTQGTVLASVLLPDPSGLNRLLPAVFRMHALPAASCPSPSVYRLPASHTAGTEGKERSCHLPRGKGRVGPSHKQFESWKTSRLEEKCDSSVPGSGETIRASWEPWCLSRGSRDISRGDASQEPAGEPPPLKRRPEPPERPDALSRDCTPLERLWTHLERRRLPRALSRGTRLWRDDQSILGALVPLKRLRRVDQEPAASRRPLERQPALERRLESLGRTHGSREAPTHLESRGLLDVSEETLALVRPSKPLTRPESLSKSLLRGGGRVSRGPSLGGLWRGIGLLRGHQSLSRDLTPLQRRRVHLEGRGLRGPSLKRPRLLRDHRGLLRGLRPPQSPNYGSSEAPLLEVSQSVSGEPTL